VAAAAVLGDGADRRLVGYVVGAGGDVPPPAGELRAWLAERLPGYLVPEAIVRLDELPLNGSGKLDRARLPRPSAARPDTITPYAAPATPTEQRVADVWSTVLGIDRIGRHDNFFDLGGNSVRLLAVFQELSELMGPDGGLTMVDLFRHPDVAALAARLDHSAEPGGGGAARRRGHDRRARLEARAARGRTGSNPAKGSTA
jgi:hypothetical protein